MTAYCLRCHERVEIVRPHEVVMKNGKNAVRGTCPRCGTAVSKIVGKA